MGALSLAADLGVGLPAQSALRMALLAERVGRALSLPAAARAELYYAALLRYLGCSGYAHEEATVTAGDDRALLPTLELCDTTNLVEVATAVVRKVGRGRPLATRAGAVARFLSDPQGYAKVARAHCDQAVALARGLDLPATVVTALGQVYERHDGRGAPHRLAGDQIVMPARVTMLAQVVEAFFRAGARRRRSRSFASGAASSSIQPSQTPFLQTRRRSSRRWRPLRSGTSSSTRSPNLGDRFHPLGSHRSRQPSRPTSI
jgi:hypothetical protein